MKMYLHNFSFIFFFHHWNVSLISDFERNIFQSLFKLDQEWNFENDVLSSIVRDKSNNDAPLFNNDRVGERRYSIRKPLYLNSEIKRVTGLISFSQSVFPQWGNDTF